MSEKRYLLCDSCGATLPLPASPLDPKAGSWVKFDKVTASGGVTLHWCGKCDAFDLMKRLEAL